MPGRRVKRLEDAGVILRYTAILDPGKVGIGEAVFAHVSMKCHSKSSSIEFAELMRKQPEVMECFFTTGAAHVILRVATSSVAAYDTFLESVIFNAPGVVPGPLRLCTPADQVRDRIAALISQESWSARFNPSISTALSR